MLKLDNLKIGKKGISYMIGYILLITMAIALAILVFNWLSHYVPEEDPTEDICPEGVSLSLRNIVCDSGQTELSFTIRNNGLFSVDGFRVGVNDKEGSELGVYTIETSGASISPESEYNLSLIHI